MTAKKNADGHQVKKVEKTNDQRITTEARSLSRAYSKIPRQKKQLANKMIQRLAFMTITLENLEKDIKTRGAIYLMENGKQKMLVENPAQKSYNTMINRYTALNSKLMDLLPKTAIEIQTTTGKNDLDSFINERRHERD